MRALAGLAAGAAMALAGGAATAALPLQPVGLPDGTYNCIAGNSGMTMLTLGQVTLSGGRYVFRTEQRRGPTTSGAYTLAPDRSMTFSGDFGVLRHDNILGPHQEPYTVHAFAFHFITRGGSYQIVASCKRM